MNTSTEAAGIESLRQHAYLRAVLDNMPQGISVFDEHLKLRIWNKGFAEVLALPADAVYEGVPFEDLIRYPARRGEYGPGDPEEKVQAIRQLALKFEAHCFERARPNGRTHLVQGEPLFLEGRIAGFITTYTDITERKAAEQALQQHHDLLTTLVEHIPGGITLFNKNLDLVVHNKEFSRLLDLPESLFAGKSPGLEDLFRYNAGRGEYGPGSPDEIVANLLERARHPVQHCFERQRPNGQFLEVRGSPLPDGSFVTVYTDITERRQAEEKLLLADKVFLHSPTGIVIADREQRILSANPAFAKITGMDLRRVAGKVIFDLHPKEPSWPAMIEALGTRGAWSGEVAARKPNGESYFVGLTVSRIVDDHGGLPTHHIWMFSDVTERRQSEEHARHLAQHDTLTGLPNRLAFLMRLAQVLPEARRHEWKVAVMFIDLDRFKNINDTLGHQVGDDLLCEVACRLAKTVRETDMVARLGGDEFVVILPAIDLPSDAALVAGKIVAALSAPVITGPHELHTSPSIGISIFPADGQDGDTILKNADTAMYHAKAAGRNNYQFYADEMNLSASERLGLENKLRQAVVRQEFVLVFQPQFKSDGKKPTGVEALVRWHHPEDGIIPPDKFIPIAEETGLIVAIGDWVLHAACREVSRWLEAGLPPLRVAVNVSARQLRRRDFAETVAGALAQSGLPAELLELEITESAVMENPQEAIAILQILRRMGITLAIDDFGTGYSSLAYLKLFPIDHLKIDRSFVADIETDLNDRAIAFGTIALAHSLGLNVIAEGVETPDQLELLRCNACDEVQGYLFSKPLAGPAAFAFLHARSQPE